MNRNAFSLIELIFVMLILGILAAVAVVKSSGMTERAREAKLEAFTGTLNRSVGGTLWLRSIGDNRNGSVAFADYDADIDNYISLIPEYSSGPSLINCNTTGNGIFLSYTFSKIYEIHCQDGSKTTTPNFRLYNQTDSTYIK